MPEPANASATFTPPSGTVPAHHRRSASSDMNDAAEIRDYETRIAQGHHLQYRPLCTALSLVQGAVHQPFTRCDKEALHYQNLYQIFSIAAVVGGASTIVVAILEFVIPGHDEPLTKLEGIVAAVTLLLIAIGIVWEFKEKWLTARYKAENLRLLKFRSLTDSRLWCPPIHMDRLREELGDEVRKYEGHNFAKAKAWAAEGVHPRICAPPCADTCDEALHELIEYYRPKRLHTQTEYLSQKFRKSEERGAWSARVVRGVFFASFAIVLGHLLVQFYATHGKPAQSGGSQIIVPSGGAQIAGPSSAGDYDGIKWLIAAAAILPVVAAGFRTYRGSLEFERN